MVCCRQPLTGPYLFQMVTARKSSLTHSRLSSEEPEGAKAMSVLALLGASVRHMHTPNIQLCQSELLWRCAGSERNGLYFLGLGDKALTCSPGWS